MSQIFNDLYSNVTATGSEITVAVGYAPSKVQITNRTTLITTIYYSNLPTNNTYLVNSAGNKTLDTSGLIVPTVNGFTIAAGVGAASEILDYEVIR